MPLSEGFADTMFFRLFAIYIAAADGVSLPLLMPLDAAIRQRRFTPVMSRHFAPRAPLLPAYRFRAIARDAMLLLLRCSCQHTYTNGDE